MDPLDEINALLPACSARAKQELLRLLRRENPIHGLEADWNVTAEVVLEAIARAPELTQRMFRGILAEAACKVEAVDKLNGWQDVTPAGNFAYDFKVQNASQIVTIQTKLQRKRKGIPLRANQVRGLRNPEQFVVETQKSRRGLDKATGENTRPYRFGEFDILAVSMEPVTKNWTSFRFTVSRWLIPRPENRKLIAIYQPVSLQPDDDWTGDLATAIAWFFSGVEKTIDNAGGEGARKAHE